MSETNTITQETVYDQFEKGKAEWDARLKASGLSEAEFILENPDGWPIQFLAEYQKAKEFTEAMGLTMPVLVKGIDIHLTERADGNTYVDLRDVDDVIDVSKVDYSDMVKQLAKDGDFILERLTPSDAHVWHMATGVSGEAGELLDAIKKAVIYRKTIDIENVIEELGDLEFYLEGIRQGLGISRQETLDANIYKLGKRYKNHQYSDEQANARADKD